MRRMMFTAFLFCFIQTYAKTPIPEALLNAKTAVVINEGAEGKDFDKFCKRLKEWGRFELVQDQRRRRYCHQAICTASNSNCSAA